MADRTIVYPPLPEDLERGASWRSFRYFGAGAIVASVTIASGETLFGSRAGAVFGYALLWCFVAGAVMKGVQVYTGMRYMVLTGEHPMTHWAYLPGPRGWVPIAVGILTLVCFPFWQSGLPLMLGNILNWILGIESSDSHYWAWARVWATLAIVISLVLVLLESYAFLERAQTIMVALLLGCLLAAVVVARPDWWAALVGTMTPRVPDYEPWVAARYPEIVAHSPWVEVMTYVGAVGGGTYDYVGYVGMLREKGWGAVGSKADRYAVDVTPPATPLPLDTRRENLSRGRRWLLPAQIDLGICFASVMVFTICFALLGARILNPEQLVPSGTELFSHQARFLTELHPALLYVYQLGIFMAFFGTIYGAFEVYARTAYECLTPVGTWFRRFTFERFRRAIVLYCGVMGLLFLWTLTLRMNPDEVVRPAALVGGVFSCGLWCLAMLWTERRFLPREVRMPRLLWLATLVSGIAMTAMGAKAIWDYLAAWI